jgi:hypothetical protein
LLDHLEEKSEAALLKESEIEPLNHQGDLDREQFFRKTDYWSTQILITRPCLIRSKQLIQNQSQASAKFDAKASKACVTAAVEIVELFPDQPTVDFIYTKGPWWAIGHISKRISSEE